MSRFWEQCPLIELHAHLRGAMQPDFFFSLCSITPPARIIPEITPFHQKLFSSVPSIRSFLANPAPSLEDVKTLYSCDSLRSFLLTYLLTGYFIRTRDNFEALVEHVLQWFSKQSHIYVELTVSVHDYLARGIPLEAILDCLSRFHSRQNLRVKWIVDPVRNSGPEKCFSTVQEICRSSINAFSGITLGGMEDSFPSGDFHSLYQLTYEAGMGCTIHAGETGDPESIYEALKLPGLSRIGHGIRAVEDDNLCQKLKDREITLEICPTANIFTGLVSEVAEHPIYRLVEKDVPLTVNTDDPAFFNCILSGELAMLEQHGLKRKYLIETQYQSLRSSFCSESEKQELKEILDSKYRSISFPAAED